jgi:hypothetical protein
MPTIPFTNPNFHSSIYKRVSEIIQNKFDMKDIVQLLDLIGNQNDYLLNHDCKTVTKNQM